MRFHQEAHGKALVLVLPEDAAINTTRLDHAPFIRAVGEPRLCLSAAAGSTGVAAFRGQDPDRTKAAWQPAANEVPTWFLHAEEGRMIASATQAFMADRIGATTRLHRTDHAPLISQPGSVVDIIVEAMDSVRGDVHAVGRPR
jgi:pimeloyl-ACP methyl ester carboxylesterase